MGITSNGLSGVILALGNYTNKPAYIGIGSGSGTISTLTTGLFKEFDRKALTSTEMSIGASVKKITWTADFDAVSMSGKSVCEFDLSTGSPAGGYIWNIENLGTPVIYDGDNELRIVINWVTY